MADFISEFISDLIKCILALVVISYMYYISQNRNPGCLSHIIFLIVIVCLGLLDRYF